MMEHHLYQCSYDVLSNDTPEVERFMILNRYKAQIVRLHARRRQKLMLGADAQNIMEGKEPIYCTYSNSINALKRLI
jgi:hypothetical protein